MNVQTEQYERTTAQQDTSGGETAASTSDATSLQPGTRMGDYAIHEPIGRGGMGVVYRATHVATGRRVAVKVMHPSLARVPEAVRQFRCEVAVLERLSHPNVVAGIDADTAHRTPFVVLEHVRGQTLTQRVRANGPLPTAVAVNRIVQTARGLEHAHGRGVVHRDIKPANVLVDSHGQVKIVDFGLACWKNAACKKGTPLRPFTSPVGTPDYMPPEQAVDGNGSDHRADIYSLGCTLFFLLTGRPPYAGGGPADKMLAHCRAPIPSLTEARRRVQSPRACGPRRVESDAVLKRLDAVFRRMVAKRPEDRYQSMTEVIAALASCVERRSRAQTRRTPRRGPVPPRAPRLRMRS